MNESEYFSAANQTIKEDITQAIKDDENLEAVAGDIRVLLQEGKIVLEGEVFTPEQSDLAVNTATAFITPLRIHNRLAVKPEKVKLTE
jgi:osmotically-inducible protein OsmY